MYNDFVKQKLEQSGETFVNEYMLLADNDVRYKDEMMQFIHSKSEYDFV